MQLSVVGWGRILFDVKKQYYCKEDWEGAQSKNGSTKNNKIRIVNRVKKKTDCVNECGPIVEFRVVAPRTCQTKFSTVFYEHRTSNSDE